MDKLRTETTNGITIEAWIKEDNSVNLTKRMKVSFDLPDGTRYETEAYPEATEGFLVGGLRTQFEFAEAIKKLKWAVRGGRRAGAGRKPKGTTSKVKVSYYLDSEVVETIRSQPNQAEFIEAAVREKDLRG